MNVSNILVRVALGKSDDVQGLKEAVANSTDRDELRQLAKKLDKLKDKLQTLDFLNQHTAHAVAALFAVTDGLAARGVVVTPPSEDGIDRFLTQVILAVNQAADESPPSSPKDVTPL